jgi:hypothetical protein
MTPELFPVLVASGLWIKSRIRPAHDRFVNPQAEKQRPHDGFTVRPQ